MSSEKSETAQPRAAAFCLVNTLSNHLSSPSTTDLVARRFCWSRLMRLLGLLSVLAPLVASAQIPIDSSTPSTSSTTLVDALSADPDYTHLIRLLQRSRLIPTLARLNGTTLFAPTNHAIERHATSNSLWGAELYGDDGYPRAHDNIQEKLRQELLYHMLNGTLPPFPQPEELTVQVHDTLHYPRKPIDPPTGDPPPSPPWIPEPGGTLGGLPQRLRLAGRNKGIWVGVDAFGKGGAKVIKERVDVANGALVGIDGVLEPPPSLGTFYTIVDGTRWEIKWPFSDAHSGALFPILLQPHQEHRD